MSARVWTREELDRVHPFSDERKAEGWQWMDLVAEGQGWAAVIPPIREVDIELGILAAIVWVDARGRCCCDYSHPADVALAVILASKGLDSLDAMAAAMERRAVDAQARASVGGGFSDCIHAARADGQQREAVHAAAMLRSGTVQP